MTMGGEPPRSFSFEEQLVLLERRPIVRQGPDDSLVSVDAIAEHVNERVGDITAARGLERVVPLVAHDEGVSIRAFPVKDSLYRGEFSTV
jgi:hypothetical protein